jgi:hypothetical protein
MPSSRMLRHVTLIRTDVSEERIASISFLRSMFQLLVTANFVPCLADSCHPNDGGDANLRNVGSYKSHAA